MKRWVLPLVLWLSVVLLAILVAFRPLIQPSEPMNLGEVIAWLALGPGAVWLAGMTISFLLEEIPGWATAISGRLRAFIVLALACLIAVGAHFLQLRADILAQLDPWYKLAFLIVTTWVSTQVTYSGRKSKGLIARPGVR